LDHLEAFQGEVGRRILKLSRFHSTLSTRIALKWPSISARILIRKLSLPISVPRFREISLDLGDLMVI